jgi:nucleotide-binding universal stress UspA family protein
MMFKKILLATDGSPHAEEALKYARGLALRGEAQVIVVHAVPRAGSTPILLVRAR